LQFQLADLFECLCDARPEAEAVVAGPLRRSRGELDARANRLAHHFASCGIRRGDRVGVYAHNRIEWVETLLACWKLGAAAVNVNFRYTPAELRELWQDAGWAGLVHERGFAAAVARAAHALPPLRACLVLEDGSHAADAPGEDFEAALAAAPAGRGFAPRCADDLHLVWTGGTTGRPKGVVWRHEDLFFNVSGPLARGLSRPEDLEARSGDPFGLRTLVLSPLMHGGGQFPLLLTLLHGGVVILPTSRSFDPHEALALIGRERVRAVSW
jgi:acyl-CoA synthetase (AMP-forming)/AMP-acid ligase II